MGRHWTAVALWTSQGGEGHVLPKLRGGGQRTAGEIATWLRGQQIEIFDWRAQRGGRFIPHIEAAIQRAEGFFALLSPSFLKSDWCSREKEMALHREQALQATDPQLVLQPDFVTWRFSVVGRSSVA